MKENWLERQIRLAKEVYDKFPEWKKRFYEEQE